MGTQYAVEAFGGEGLPYCAVSASTSLLMVLPLLSAGLPALYCQSKESIKLCHIQDFKELTKAGTIDRALWLDIPYALRNIVS